MSNSIASIKLALGADFLVAFSRIPGKQQKKVREFLDKFSETPDASGLNYEKIHGAKDANLRSVRVDQEYRAIVLRPQQGNVHVVLWVDKHDDAYHWAERRVCAVHPETGTMQVVLTEEAAAQTLAESTSTPGPKPAEDKPPSVFTQADSVLTSLGVPSSMLSHVREVTSDTDVDRLESILPREAFEAVFLLAAGYSPDEVKAELAIARTSMVDTTDFAAAVDREGSKRQFIVISDAAEMEKILAAPLEQWRVFLHPSQRKLVEMKANGPVRVLGSAGTGKTVVALHRAVWLVRNVCKSGEKVLFTTFTKNLATDIGSNLKKIATHEEWERIEVVNLDAWVCRFLEKQQFPLRLTYLDEPERQELWKRSIETLGDPEYSEEFLRDEWDNVIQAQAIEIWEAYMTASRAGRSRRLSRQERKVIWPVFEEYRALLSERGLCEPADAFRAAARLIDERNVTFPYRSALVDEGQDFGNEAFHLLRMVIPQNENDLFIVGDAHQRLYGHQAVLSRVGVDIRGRGRKLRINYRTTEELKNWGTGLLKGLSFDDLDAGVDPVDAVRSLVHGEPPIIKKCGSAVDACTEISQHLADIIIQNARPETICLVARTHKELKFYEDQLKEKNLHFYSIKPSESDEGKAAGIRIATIHRIKGLEFDHVIIVDKYRQIEDLKQKERALLYVAATRARRSLLVCWIENS